MREYYTITGYWKDNGEVFSDYIVTNYDDFDVDSDFMEDEIFYFGMEQSDLEQAIEDGKNTIEDFVITNFEKI